MSHNSIGDRLRIVRGKESLPSFAKRFNIHKNTLARYEKGESQPDSAFLQQICADFDVTPLWILIGDGPMRHVEDDANDQPAFFRGYPGKSKDEPSGYDDKAESSQMGLGQAVELLAKIFGSNNHILMRAIIANLQAFGEAIDSKNKELQARDEMAQMQSRMSVLEKQVAELLGKLKDTEGKDSQEVKKVANG